MLHVPVEQLEFKISLPVKVNQDEDALWEAHLPCRAGHGASTTALAAGGRLLIFLYTMLSGCVTVSGSAAAEVEHMRSGGSHALPGRSPYAARRRSYK